MIKKRILLLGLSVLSILVSNILTVGSHVVYASGGQTNTSMQWTAADNAEPSGWNSAGLTNISCPTADFCQAVGVYTDTNNAEHSLVQRYDGTDWAVVESQDLAGALDIEFTGITCLSPSFCQAVGTYLTAGFGLQSFVHDYDGTGWNMIAIPNPVGAQTTWLGGVDCVSPSFCQAVGSYRDGSSNHPLILTYDGTDWSTAINPDLAGATLRKVDCVSATFCQAVGAYVDNDNYIHPYIQTYDGSSWSTAASPEVINDASVTSLMDVVCLSATLCQAVGYYREPDNTMHSMTQMYDGTSWSLATVANQAGYEIAILYDVDCASPTSCQAVGSYDGSGNVQHPLVHTYNGTSWSVAIVPEPDDAVRGNLGAVSCAAANACHAGGTYKTVEDTYPQLIENYDGSAWSVANRLDLASSGFGYFTDIDCASPTSCQAVGTYGDADNHTHALIATYGPVETPAAVDTGSSVVVSLTKTTSLSSLINLGYANASSARTITSADIANEAVDETKRANTFATTGDSATPEMNRDTTANETAAGDNALYRNWRWVVVVGVGLAVFMVASLKAYRRSGRRTVK